MRILVTGGAGFIGSHVIDRLMAQGHEVICLDNFYTGLKRNILKWMEYPNFELLRHDVTEPIRLEVEQIYHLACPTASVHCQYNPVNTIETHAIGTLNMLGLAKRVKARFFLASTSDVYGDPEIYPQTEDYRGHVKLNEIRSCYDEGKRIAETLAFDYHRQYGVKIRVARIFNTYGSRMSDSDGRIISNLLVQALRNQPLIVYGNGFQTRNFCYVTDIVEGAIRLMNGEYVGPVNLGSPDEYTVLELAQIIQKLVHPHVEIKFAPLMQDDPRHSCPDITRAKVWLSWEPKISLQEGLRLTMENFRSRLD